MYAKIAIITEQKNLKKTTKLIELVNNLQNMNFIKEEMWLDDVIGKIIYKTKGLLNTQPV